MRTFRVRTLMIAVGMVALAMALLPLCEWVVTGRGIGISHRVLTFVVRDERQRTIEGASIDLRDPDFISTPKSPELVSLKTGPDGRVDAPLNLVFTEVVSALTGRLLSVHVRYPRWNVRVRARGYRDFSAPFSDFESRNPEFHSTTPPPPIVIQLRAKR